ARPVALRGVTRGVEIRARDAEDFTEGRIGQDRNLRAGRRLVARRRDERRTGPLIDLVVGQAVVVEPVAELVLAGAVEDARRLGAILPAVAFVAGLEKPDPAAEHVRGDGEVGHGRVVDRRDLDDAVERVGERRVDQEPRGDGAAVAYGLAVPAVLID